MKTQERIMFDVGAHDGHTGITQLLNDRYDKVYAFEVNPSSLKQIKKRLENAISEKPEIKDKYILIEKAVSNFSGKSNFNNFIKSDIGSLLEPNRKEGIGTVNRVKDFSLVSKKEEEVITLEKFCREEKITHIDYLHVDTQGSDLNVLKGLSDLIEIVKEGRIEAYDPTIQTCLYENATNTKEECINYLEKYGFHIKGFRPADYDIDIFFYKPTTIPTLGFKE